MEDAKPCPTPMSLSNKLSSHDNEVHWIHNLLTELGISLQTHAPVLWCDNLGAQALALNLVYHARTKRIDLDVHFIRDLIAEGKIDVRYVPTEAQPNGLLNKPFYFSRFLLSLR